MDKIETSKDQETSLNKQKIELRIEDFSGLKKSDLLKDLTDTNQISMAVFECLLNNDPDGAMEMIEIYLEATNKAKLRRRTKLPKSTMYSALKHKNPTIKTLAKIMYLSTH